MRSALKSPPTAHTIHQSVSMLRLVWQDVDTRRFIEVGRLSQLADGAFSFQYSDGADHPRFQCLAEFPDRDGIYESNALPAFFGNRVMSSQRESYGQYCGWLGLSDVATPMEILARTGGGRATDTFHVVDSFLPLDGVHSGRFFASGVRYLDGADERLRALVPGQELLLRPQPDNPVNELAILLDADAGQPVGWVPDWLVGEVHELLNAGAVHVRVAQVNPDAPSHLRLMCALEALPQRIEQLVGG